MRILVIGSGAREHALIWKLAGQSDLLHAAPGNPGIARLAKCHDVSVSDKVGLVRLARDLRIDLVVVGPEAPLVAGLADDLRAGGIMVFGPGRSAAKIEGSKSFAKELMTQSGIPTARWERFDDPERAEAYAAAMGRAVIKADGLAAGKGVIVAENSDAARAAVRAIMRDKAFGDAGKLVVVEEFLEGEEASAIALCDGERFVLLPSAQDHKRLGDGDTGPNTGGMGAYSPTPALPPLMSEEVGKTIIAPALRSLAERGTPFIGALYAGLMITREGPKVIEFNCRFGDPETQPQLMRMQGDLASVLVSAASGKLEKDLLRWKEEIAIGVVLAARGYPGSPVYGAPISGLDELEQGDDLFVFHAGTKMAGGNLVTSGGRVLTVGALGASVRAAQEKAYRAIAGISFDGMQFRRDIGFRAAGA